MGIGCQQEAPIGAPAGQIANSDFGTKEMELQTSCSVVEDCAEYVHLANDPCVVQPGVTCNGNGFCAVQLDASCYIDADAYECSTDEQCNDGNPCTYDRCVIGQDGSFCYKADQPAGTICGYDQSADVDMVCEDGPIAGSPNCVTNYACESNADCSDGDSCTSDYCFGGECSHWDVWDCTLCDSSSDCSDMDTQYCSNGEYYTQSHGCSDEGICKQTSYSGGDCVTGCNDDGTCKDFDAEPTPECESDEDCSHLSTSTCGGGTVETDAFACAENGMCESVGGGVMDCTTCNDDGTCADTEPTPECTTDGDCADDGDPCTTQTCNSGTCQTETDDACCTSDTECDDGDDCTDDVCSSNSCSSTDNGSCAATCSETADCDNSDIAYPQVCEDSECVTYPEPVLTVGWEMPASWNVQYVSMIGTYCYGDGSCMDTWGAFLTYNMDAPATTMWDGTQGQIGLKGELNFKYVTATLKVPVGVTKMRVQWKWTTENTNQHWLCNNPSEPVSYDAWGDSDNYGDITFSDPDGQTLEQVVIADGQGCYFEIDVSSVTAFN